MAKRKIIKIDEAKCNGCGLCVPNCHEGALQIIDGKARLVGDFLCDGLGACIGECPEGALTIEEREAEEFDQDRVVKTDISKKKAPDELPCGCPGTMMRDFRGEKKVEAKATSLSTSSQLQQWPIQLQLLNPIAPYFKDADLAIAADCVPFSYSNFHERFLKGKALIILCPKLDKTLDMYVEKLSEIFKQNNIKSITLLHMEVPCCFGLVSLVQEALKKSGKNIIIKEYTISLKGELV